MSIVHAALPPTMKLADLKTETLPALRADVARDALDILAMDPPEIDVLTTDDFEICRPIKEKGKPTGTFETLDPSKSLRDSGIAGWETLFLQFRDRESGKLYFQSIKSTRFHASNRPFLPLHDIGNISPVVYTLPPMYDDEEATAITQEDRKGKRKASVELDEDALDF